jgi:ribosomal protein L16 Arg81 hydroxylase
MDRITIEQILDPITPRKFFKEYWNKKHLVIRRNSFKNLYTWNHFSNYLNQYPKINNLQIIDYNDKNDRWCLDKIRKGELKAPMISKQKVYDLFKNKNKTIVIPFAEYQNKALVDVCFTLERFFGSGQSNVYISPSAKSKSFPAHADSTENFLFHTEGRVKWKIYEEFAPGKPKNVIDEFILEAGDLLYIPQFQFHEVETIGPRILVSCHFKNKERQSINNFKVTQIEDSKRNKWYNWKPELYINDKINPDFAYNFRHTGGWKKKYL